MKSIFIFYNSRIIILIIIIKMILVYLLFSNMDLTDPKAYVVNNDAQRKTTLEILNEYSYELKQMSGSCIDIGCGPGDITKNYLLPMLHPKATIVGADVSISMLEYAIKKYQNEKNITFAQLDIETKNLPKKYISAFDHTFSFYALHWCSEIRRTFQNIYNMLRPKGTIFINMVYKHNIFEVINDFAENHRYSQYIKIRPSLSQNYVNSQKGMEELLNSIGYRISHCSVRRIKTRYENVDVFISMIMSFSTLFIDIPQKLKQQFREDFTNEYKKRSKQRNQDPYWSDEYFLLVFYGFKDA